jgi:hypothetical protein
VATVTPILDGVGSFATFRYVFPDASEELDARAHELAPETFRGEDWVLPVRAYVIETGEARVLVDTGLGPEPREFMPDTPSELLDGLDAESIDVVTFTHLHVDHIGWNSAFSQARFVVADEEWQGTVGTSGVALAMRVSSRQWSRTSSSFQAKHQSRPACGSCRPRVTRPGIASWSSRRTTAMSFSSATFVCTRCISPTRISRTSATSTKKWPQRRGGASSSGSLTTSCS